MAAFAAIIILVAFFLARNVMHHVFLGHDLFRVSVILGLAAIVALGFSFVRYRDVPPFLSPLARFSAIGVALYLLIEPPAFTLANPDASAMASLLKYMYWPALAAAFLSIWRPSLAIFPPVLILATRDVAAHLSGFSISTLDIKYMMEMSVFLGSMASVVGALGDRLPATFRLEFAKCVAFAGIGLHLANYFWSGVAKLFLGPTPWSWVLENETPYMMAVALDRGVLPLGSLPLVTDWLYQGAITGYPLSNAFVLLTQLAAIVAILRVHWLKLASLAYDALHIGIWVLGGLFFWPWIWNNLSVFMAVRNQSDAGVGWAPKIVCAVTILLGGSHTLGDAARLAWWDVPDLKHGRFEVHAGQDAPWIKVPVSFWMSHSYPVSHGYQDLAVIEGHYPPTIWGSALDYERATTAGTCPSPASVAWSSAPVETASERQDRLDRVAAFVSAHHEKMQRNQDRYGDIFAIPWFYWRSHHHPSVPWLHPDFNALDLSTITQYRLATRSLCLSLEGGALQRHIIEEEEVIFDVQRRSNDNRL